MFIKNFFLCFSLFVTFSSIFSCSSNDNNRNDNRARENRNEKVRINKNKKAGDKKAHHFSSENIAKELVHSDSTSEFEDAVSQLKRSGGFECNNGEIYKLIESIGKEQIWKNASETQKSKIRHEIIDIVRNECPSINEDILENIVDDHL